ncbi:MAG: hypothetical protein ACOC4I_06755, partial [Spirochaetota bacterium]
LVAVVPESYINRVSTRKVDDRVQSMGVTGDLHESGTTHEPAGMHQQGDYRRHRYGNTGSAHGEEKLHHSTGRKQARPRPLYLTPQQ